MSNSQNNQSQSKPTPLFHSLTAPSDSATPAHPYTELKSQLKAIIELLECGFQFEQAKRIVLTILEVKEEFPALSEVTVPGKDIAPAHTHALRVVPHPRGWTVLSCRGGHRPYAFFETRHEALDRARTDAVAAECPLYIYTLDGDLEALIAAPRNY
ncbi:MAG: hypothetical protein KDD60_04890 [Bdellovibrionales bacterium]|nr:hypothetical protein [Bdellovibrionales bacterium]